MKTIDKFFKRNTTDVSSSYMIKPSSLNILTHEQEQCEPNRARLFQEEIDGFHIEVDPGLRP